MKKACPWFSRGWIALWLCGSAWLSRADSRMFAWGHAWYAHSGPVSFVRALTPPAHVTDVVAIASGAGHSLALRADGRVVAWGDNTLGQATVPAGLTGVVAIAAGYWHSLALRADGTVVAWGAGSTPDPDDPSGAAFGQSIVPADLTNAVAVSAGFLHSLALRADGTVIGWGANNWGQTSPPTALSNVVAIASREGPCLALKADGTVAVWGFTQPWHTNVPPNLTNAVAVAAGGSHCLALRAEGRVVGWGDNGRGQIDIPDGLSNVVAIAAGNEHSLALQADGTVVAWGAGKIVAPADGEFGQAIVPTNLSSVSAIAAGTYQSLALIADGAPFLTSPLVDRTVVHGTTTWLRMTAAGANPLSYQWRFKGADLPGATNAVLELAGVRGEQAGTYSVIVSNAFGTTTGREMRLQVVPLIITQPPRSQVATRGGTATFEVALTGSGPFEYQWQFNGENLPGATEPILTITNVQATRTGRYSVVVGNAFGSVSSESATLSLTQVMAWGDNAYGQTNVPAGTDGVVALAGGARHSLALRADGTLVAWGHNTSEQATIPAGLTGVVAIATGSIHNLALKADGIVKAWGSMENVPAGLTNVAAIAAGHQHNLALRADGTVVAWGDNTSGQTNVPPDLQNVVAISAGRSSSLALKADGTLVIWGRLMQAAWPPVPGGPEPPPPPPTDIVAIAAGAGHYLALCADGHVESRGNDWYGEADVPAGLSNVIAVAAGEYHSQALKSDGTLVSWGFLATRSSGAGGPYIPAKVPPHVSNVVAIASGFNHILALAGVGPPVFSKVRVNPTAIHGGTLVLRAEALGALPLSYQWLYQGTALPGATNAVLVVRDVRADQAGVYSVVAQNELDLASEDITVAVVPLLITTQPQSQSVCRGTPVRLRVAAAGPEPFGYQWRLNGNPLPGATNATLWLEDAQVEQSGLYSVVVSNALGTAISDDAEVSIGRVLAWGSNEYGQTNLPPGLTDISAVAAGGSHNLALRGDGRLIAWGRDINGLSGQGQTPRPDDLTNLVAIAAGGNHDLALRADGTVVAWGQLYMGEPSVPARLSTLSNAIAIAAGSAHSLALKCDGTVVGWGYNADGQARVPPRLADVVAIAAGGGHSLALKADGRVTVWGTGGWTGLESPPDLSNVVAIAAGTQHSLALTADGTVVAWGAGYAGQTNVPPDLTNVVAISAGGHHNLVLKRDGTLVGWGGTAASLNSIPAIASSVVAFAAGSSHNLILVDSLSLPLVTIEPPAPQPPGFPQSKAWWQVVRVFNRSPLSIPAVRVTIAGLPENTLVGNASGTDPEGMPYIQHNYLLAPGACIDLTLEYLPPDGAIPQPTLLARAVSPTPPIEPVGTLQEITRGWRLTNGCYVVEFLAQNPGIYYVQYGSDLDVWKTASPSLSGNGAGLHWVDNGPPKTESHPLTQLSRFYRVVRVP